MSNLLLGVRTSLFDFKLIKLEKMNLDLKVKCFKEEVSKTANIPKESLDLVYCGNILNDEFTLRANGVKPGVMVHVLKKKEKETPHFVQPMTEADILELVAAFRRLTLSPSYKTFLQKLSRPDILDNIIMITPGLSQDPVAISIIQDPELLVRIGDIETVRRIVKLHPSLAEAAYHIAAAAHEESVSNNDAAPSTSSGLSHLLEVISDENEMESSQSSDSVQHEVSRQPSFAAITSAQLNAAMPSGFQGSSGVATTVGRGGGDHGENNRSILPESEAWRQIGVTVAPNSRDTNNLESSSQGDSNDLTEQMRQMQELGLTDDMVNFQALQLAGGNVHAAIGLIFSDVISSDHQ